MDETKILSSGELFGQAFDIAARTSGLAGSEWPDEYNEEFVGRFSGEPAEALGKAKSICSWVREAGGEAECELLEQVPDDELEEFQAHHEEPYYYVRITIGNEATATQ